MDSQYLMIRLKIVREENCADTIIYSNSAIARFKRLDEVVDYYEKAPGQENSDRADIVF